MWVELRLLNPAAIALACCVAVHRASQDRLRDRGEKPALAGSPDSMPKRRPRFDTDRVKRGAVLVGLPSEA